MIETTGSRSRVAPNRHLFSPEGVYLNSATYGLPPRPSIEAMQSCADEWRHGRTGFDGWDRSVGSARATFARIHGVGPGDVAIGPQVSVFVGLVAASLRRGTRVLAPDGDFTSLLFPFMARGLDVRLVALEDLAEAVDSDTDLVAFSAVQSADGRLADLDAICAATAHHGARTLCDATQACGWMPIDAARFDVLVTAGYKWMLNPRGTCFMTVRPEMREALAPIDAGWYAGPVPVETLYGGPVRLADDARRFDVSPAWITWVGAAPALALIEDVGIASIHGHDVGLANALRSGLGMEPSNSAIVSLDLDQGARDRLRAASVMTAERGEGVRLSFHLYNGENDVDRALAAVAQVSS